MIFYRSTSQSFQAGDTFEMYTSSINAWHVESYCLFLHVHTHRYVHKSNEYRLCNITRQSYDLNKRSRELLFNIHVYTYIYIYRNTFTCAILDGTDKIKQKFSRAYA